MQLDDSQVVDAFVEYLNVHGYPGLKVESRPDEENRNSPDIDAIAGPFAIEHTQIETLPNQHRDGHWFQQVTGNLKSEFREELPFHLTITLDYESVSKGQDWAAINEAIRTWVKYHAHDLAEGRHVINNADGVPFRLCVSKTEKFSPGLYFARYAPNDVTLPSRIRAAANRKAAKLAPYRSEGKTAILLFENNDIALMNCIKMLDAFRSAFPSSIPAGVDHIWFADTSFQDPIQFEDFTESLLRQQRPMDPSGRRGGWGYSLKR